MLDRAADRADQRQMRPTNGSPRSPNDN